MKVLFSIITAYLVALFIMPCGDLYKKDMSHAHEYPIQTSYQYDHVHAEAVDSCSPFCVCGCCGMVSSVDFQWGIYTVKVKSFVLSKSKVYFRPIFIPSYFGEIWQPPQINA